MIETLSFRTQARTIDHLGREQIADCPTAISELWKNAYDAYARSVKLHIFDDLEPVAGIFDDGHGMSYDEFINRWLIVGTDSKFDKRTASDSDRNGLDRRTKQGQKGIGRLSSANLGPLLLVISKRKNQDFVSALIDWRIFENPYLVLADIEVPVTSFATKDDFFSILPEMFDLLTNNIWGNPNDTDPKRAERLKLAWDTYDDVTVEETPKAIKPSEAIANTIIAARFEKHHLDPWPVWSGESEHGSALIVSDINYDLRAQLPSIEPDANVKGIREALFATLSAFTDPYVNADANEHNAFDPQFSYEVRTWSRSAVPNSIVKDERNAINRSVTEELEHVLSGDVDSNGIFRGQIKAFGEWRKLGTDYTIYPPDDFKMPKGPTTFVGPFGLHVATYERTRLNSTLSDGQWKKFDDLANQHGSFLIFRNGLRVLPYGRTDNDFFGIETNRSINAGREYWNARRMFGRVAISREQNPNLRDKSGREGFIDNQSAKAFRTLVMHILKRAAYEYFGSNADLRHELMEGINEKNAKAKAEAARKTLRAKNAKKFRGRLKKLLPKLAELHQNTANLISDEIENRQDLEKVQSYINQISEQLSDLRITGAPAKLGAVEDDYRAFRTMFSEMQERVKSLEEWRAAAIETISPAQPEEIAQKQLSSLASQIQAKLRSWKKSIEGLQASENERVAKLFDERNKAFHSFAMPLVAEVEMGSLGLESALRQMQAIHLKIDEDNEDTFQSYLDTLEVMSENINIELIARQGTDDNIVLRDDLNRLNQVAQLGVTVEILGHEFSSNERMILEGIHQVRKAGDVPGTQLIEAGFEALSQQLEFLSPLKVSGTRTRRIITGLEIVEYLVSFFHVVSKSRGIKINASDEFRAFSVEEQPSRLLPVFVNLINNSVYWLVNSKTPEPEICLSIAGDKILVSDNGPGIDELDQESLFKMFFTRKSNGGRGIGLYLCRVNLMAGGHSIHYSVKSSINQLPGANFIIELKGANFG